MRREALFDIHGSYEFMEDIKTELRGLLAKAIEKTTGDGASLKSEPLFEVPRDEKFGDISTTLAMSLAKEARKPSKALAEEIAKQLTKLLKDSPAAARIEKITVEGAGFINFYYTLEELGRVIGRVRSEGEAFGKPRGILPKKVLLEFVSANPTGPLTVAHGRQAALGDSLARILKFCGHEVFREYYNNDEGVQIDTLGASMELRVKQLVENRTLDKELPENYYRGEYLVELAKEFIEKFKPKEPYPADLPVRCRVYARDRIMEGIKKDLDDFGMSFDSYYSQENLSASGKVEQSLAELKKKGVVYESEGASWFRSTDFGDDKDRVLVKSDKSYTYLTPDVAYHHEKFQRGFDMLIDIWGPDHHGYIPRLKASQAALGHDPGKIKILIAQLVTLYEGGKQMRMSTRAGEFVTLREILDEVGRDAGRFFFLMRKFDAHLDFDLALAKSQTPDNPVFYIQYAHARIESIKRTFGGQESQLPWREPAALLKLDSTAEIRLLRLVSQFEDTVLAAERTLEPFRLVPYLTELAGTFHKFYADKRVITDDAELTDARMMLALSVQSVIRSGLQLLGVSAPLKM